MSSRSLEFVPLDRLYLDQQNPRLPSEKQQTGLSEIELSKYIAVAYDALEIANSIALHGYFESEPLVVIAEDDRLVVVEGNRRLVALKGLLQPDFRSELGGGWLDLPAPSELSHVLDPPGKVPVVKAESRSAVAPLLGYRHISGIAPWEPIAQARYVHGLVADGEIPFDEVRHLIGKSLTAVMQMYRDYDIVLQAEHLFDIDTNPIRQQFGVFTKAMQTLALREYIGAPPPRDANVEEWPLEGSTPDSEAAVRLQELVTWIHGNSAGEGRIISDSRQLQDLGRIVDDPDALDVLKETSSFEKAKASLDDPSSQFSELLSRASQTLSRAAGVRPNALDPADVDQIEELISSLRELL